LLATAQTDPSRLLILGGTRDARTLAQSCAARYPLLRTISSLAGRTRTPRIAAGETRVGGFGGVQGLVDFIKQNGIDFVIDATHPFAAAISTHAAQACASAGVPRLQLLRRAWADEPEDHWLDANDMLDASRQIAETFNAGKVRVFLSTGRQQITAFSPLQDTWFLVRTVDPLDNPTPLAQCKAIVGRGPFDVDEESALLQEHAIDVLVSKNSGGEATYAKILAARRLGLPVIMLRPPAPQRGPKVFSVDEAIAWLSSPH
jgi:precorrin-6A/cobalt-precorrin-6A reductase